MHQYQFFLTICINIYWYWPWFSNDRFGGNGNAVVENENHLQEKKRKRTWPKIEGKHNMKVYVLLHFNFLVQIWTSHQEILGFDVWTYRWYVIYRTHNPISGLRYTKITFTLNLQHMKENYKNVEEMDEMPLLRSWRALGMHEFDSLYFSTSFSLRIRHPRWSLELWSNLNPFLSCHLGHFCVQRPGHFRTLIWDCVVPT